MSTFLAAPLSAKIVALTYMYWRLKTALIYKHMFAHIGKQCAIYKPMILNNANCIEIGDRVSIRNGVRLEAIRDPYGRVPSLKIGSNTNIEQNVHIICHNRVHIGSNVSITGHCAIVDTTHFYDTLAGKIGDHILDEDSFVEIGDGAFVGYGAVILPNVRIGRRAVIGANSVVTHDVPDLAVAAGMPARILKIYSHELGCWITPDEGPSLGAGS